MPKPVATREGAGPIFLVGTGRCGSTIVYSCLAMHPSLGWIPSWVSAVPGLPWLAAGNLFWALPGTDRFREARFFPKPVEPNDLFNRWFSRYRSENLDAGLIEQGRRSLTPVIRTVLKAQGKSRFLGKMVGRPVQIRLFDRLYPDARFVHIIRDLKPTVCSLLQVDFYTGGGGFDGWPWGAIPPAYLDFYERSGKAEEVKAAITVRLNRSEIDRQLAEVESSRRMELPYAEFVQDPIASVRRIGEVVGLPLDQRFLERLRARRLYGGADRKWMTYFNEKQIRNLTGVESLPEPSAP